MAEYQGDDGVLIMAMTEYYLWRDGVLEYQGDGGVPRRWWSTNYGDDRVLITREAMAEYQGGDRVPKRVPKRWLSTKAMAEYQGGDRVLRRWQSTKASDDLWTTRSRVCPERCVRETEGQSVACPTPRHVGRGQAMARWKWVEVPNNKHLIPRDCSVPENDRMRRRRPIGLFVFSLRGQVSWLVI